MTSETLNCPTCGAAISSDASQCLYCGAKVATIACPSCFGLAFIGSKFCPHCGVELERPTDLPTNLECPRCVTERMQDVTLKGTKLLECAKCCGLWLAKATFETICNSQVEQAAVLDLKIAQPPDPKWDAGRRYLPCPVCAGLMNRLNFAHYSGIVIDVCSKDGVWFDRDELRRIIEFIRGGGLERARNSEQEKLAERVRQVEATPPNSRPGSVLADTDHGVVLDAVALAGSFIGSLLK